MLFATMPLFKVLFVTIYDSSFLLAIENLWIFQIFRDFLKKPNHRLISCVKALSIGNNIISSAIWRKYALVNVNKIAWTRRASGIRNLWKIYECLSYQIAREIILLLVNNVHEKRPQKAKKDEILKACALFVICTRVTWQCARFAANQKRVIFSMYIIINKIKVALTTKWLRKKC